MIFFPIETPEKEKSGKEWRVLHPANGAILAYCTTEAEADHVIRSLKAFCECLSWTKGTKR